MFLYRKEVRKLVAEIGESMLEDFDHKSRFIIDLLEQDDWSFVIKGHAMLEAAVTELVLEHLGENRLKELIERLPLSDNQIGKVVIAKHLDLLDDDQRRFIRWFSELRNGLVHRLENINFTFEQRISAMDKNQKRSWIESIIWFAKDKTNHDQWKPLAEGQPKVAICMALLQVICRCGLKAQEFKAHRKINKAAQKTTEELLKKFRTV
jgi:hypothetical protein